MMYACLSDLEYIAWDVLCFRRDEARKLLPLMPRVRSEPDRVPHIVSSILQGFCTTVVPSAVDLPVHLASRVEVFPIGAEKKVPGSPARSSTIYFYVGLDHVTADNAGEQDGGGLIVVDSASRPRRSLLIRGVHPQFGGFEVAAAAVSTRGKTGSSDEKQKDETVAVNFLGKQNVRIGGVKDEVERLHAAHRRVRRKGDQREMPVESPFLLPDEVEAGSNVVLVQVHILNDRDAERCIIFGIT